MTYRILLFGATGQLGHALQEPLKTRGNLTALTRHNGGDLEDATALARILIDTQPDIIVNAAAYTQVDQAETDRASAYAINATAPKLMAEYARKSGALLVHYSTDYVYDGSGEAPWAETDSAAPLNYYGQTKYDGDRAIQESGCNHLILRTSWVYSAQGDNFVDKVKQKARAHTSIKMVNDQTGAPTDTGFLATTTAQMIDATLANKSLSGLYHVACSGETTWYGFAQAILDGLHLGNASITPIATRDLNLPAQRPLNSRLSQQKLVDSFGINPPHWHDRLQLVLAI